MKIARYARKLGQTSGRTAMRLLLKYQTMQRYAQMQALKKTSDMTNMPEIRRMFLPVIR